MGYQTVSLIFVKVDDVSEGFWRSLCDPSGLKIISAPTKAVGLRLFELSSDRPSVVSADNLLKLKLVLRLLEDSQDSVVDTGIISAPGKANDLGLFVLNSAVLLDFYGDIC